MCDDGRYLTQAEIEREWRRLHRLPIYAGLRVRAAAFIVDGVLFGLLAQVAIVALLLVLFAWREVGPRIHVPSAVIDLVPWDLVPWILAAVAIVWCWLRFQATPGKMLFNLRIVDAATEGPLTLTQAVGRYMAYFVAMIPWFLGIIWIAFDSKKQGWHDKLAGTIVFQYPDRQTGTRKGRNA